MHQDNQSCGYLAPSSSHSFQKGSESFYLRLSIPVYVLKKSGTEIPFSVPLLIGFTCLIIQAISANPR